MSAGFHTRKGEGCCTKRWVTLLLAHYPAIVTVFIGSVLALMLIGTMEQRMYPLLRAAARSQTESKIIVVMEQVVAEQLERIGLDYSDLVSLECLSDGDITAVTIDMAAVNRLRSTLAEKLLHELNGIDRRDIAVPVGNLLESGLLWGRGPTINVRAISVGSLRTEFESEFVAAGVSRTLHKIWITLSVPTTVLLPGEELELEVQTRLCVAETIIIGEIPSNVQKWYG